MDKEISPRMAQTAVQGFLQGVGFEMAVAESPLDQIFEQAELDRAFMAIDQIFQEFALGKDERRFRQSQLMEFLYRRGITPMLAHAGIEELIARKVFRVGETLANLRTISRLDGQTSTEITPERYLYTSHALWFGASGVRKPSPKRRGAKRPVAPRSWTQDDLDAALREYKASRAANYRELAEAVHRGGRGAIKAARGMFGRNAIAKALGVKARSMVSKSPVWREIASELRLNSEERKLKKRIGYAIGTEQASVAKGDTTQAEVELGEVIRKVRSELPREPAEALIDQLQRGENTPEDVYQIIELQRESEQDARNR